MISQIRIIQHRDQHWNDKRAQDIVVGIAGIGKGIPES